MTRDEIIRMAQQSGLLRAGDGWTEPARWGLTEIERFATLVAAKERAECAKVCEQRKIITPEWQLDQHYNQGVSHCAAAIRARGMK